MAGNLLQQVVHDSVGITMGDAQTLLKNPDYLSELLATTKDSKDTILHLAARNPSPEVTVFVLEAYRKTDLVEKVLCARNSQGDSPLNIAVKCGNAQSVVLLYNECQRSCSHVITEADDDYTILHQAVESHKQSLSITRFLLSQKESRSMLVTSWKGSVTPFDIAKQRMDAAQFRYDFAKRNCENWIATTKMNDWSAEHHRKTALKVPKEQLEQASAVFKLLELPTLEAKAQLAQKIVLEQERAKYLIKHQKTSASLWKLCESNRVKDIILQYLMAEDDKDVQVAAVQFLSDSVDVEQLACVQLTVELVNVIEKLLHYSRGDTYKHCLKILATLLSEECNATHFLNMAQERISLMSLAVDYLKSLDTDVQLYGAEIFMNLSKWCTEDARSLTEEWIQPLLLMKYFSTSESVQSVCSKALTLLGCSPQLQPNPGSWATKDVTVWINSMEFLENKQLCLKQFEDACMDGLHLLELSPLEMSGVGIKFVSEQRKLSNKIDELRRMNAQSIIGDKDIFLSYAHVNINFAKRVKNALVAANYTVWIDNTGIRAGQKWRNEIASGIHGCKAVVFLVTNRASNSEYCQDEIGLAEEFKKPIIALKLEDLNAVDPGMKLVIQRRQWIDFTNEGDFQKQCAQVIDALISLIGHGSGPERPRSSVAEDGTSQQVASKAECSTPDSSAIDEETISLEDMKSLHSSVNDLRKEVSELRAEYQESVHLICERLSAIEMSMNRLLSSGQ